MMQKIYFISSNYKKKNKILLSMAIITIIITTAIVKTNSNTATEDVNKLINTFNTTLQITKSSPKSYFYDFLKFREIYDKRIINVCEKILNEFQENDYIGNIWAYAVTQVLFNYDDNKSKSVLEKLAKRIRFDSAYEYSFHWGTFKKTNEYIQKYLIEPRICSSSDSINLELFIKQKKGNEIIFDVVFKNNTDTDIFLFKPKVYLGNHLIIASDKGIFQQKDITKIYKLGKQQKEKIQAKKSFSFLIPATIKWYGKLDCKDMYHKLDSTNKFYVYAVFDYGKTILSKSLLVEK